MARKDVKEALGSSVKAERDAVEKRLSKADAYFEARTEVALEPPEPSTPAKVIRDGFTMPACDYDLIAQVQTRCLQSGLSVTKSEVLRAGLHMLHELDPDDLRQALSKIEKVKMGRPAKR